jgi:hypothetical protein
VAHRNPSEFWHEMRFLGNRIKDVHPDEDQYILSNRVLVRE